MARIKRQLTGATEKEKIEEDVSFDEIDHEEEIVEDDGILTTFKNLDFKSIALKSVAPAAGTLVLGLIMGGMIFSGDSGPKGETVKSVQSIQGAYSILDQIDSVKDSQLKAAQMQVKALSVSGSEAIPKDQAIGIGMMIDAAEKSLDPFFEKIMSIDPYADTAELNSIQNELSKHMTPSSSTSELYKILTESSAAKELKTKTKKASGVTATWVGSGSDNFITYVALVPYATENKTGDAIYVVTLAQSGAPLIDKVTYVGSVSSASADMNAAVADHLASSAEKKSKATHATQPSVTTVVVTQGAAPEDPTRENDDPENPALEPSLQENPEPAPLFTSPKPQPSRQP